MKNDIFFSYSLKLRLVENQSFVLLWQTAFISFLAGCGCSVVCKTGFVLLCPHPLAILKSNVCASYLRTMPKLTGHLHLARRLMNGSIPPIPICFLDVQWGKFIFLCLTYPHNYLRYLRTYKINDLVPSYICNYVYNVNVHKTRAFSFLEKIWSTSFVWHIYKLAVPPQKTFRLYCEGILFKENVAVFFLGYNTKPVCTVQAQCRVLNVKAGGKCSYRCFEGLGFERIEIKVWCWIRNIRLRIVPTLG